MTNFVCLKCPENIKICFNSNLVRVHFQCNFFVQVFFLWIPVQSHLSVWNTTPYAIKFWRLYLFNLTFQCVQMLPIEALTQLLKFRVNFFTHCQQTHSLHYFFLFRGQNVFKKQTQNCIFFLIKGSFCGRKENTIKFSLELQLSSL